MANKQQITYKPDLSYQENYNTIGNNDYNNTDDSSDIINNQTSDISIITVDELTTKINDIKALFINIPTEISNICFNVINGIIPTIKYIKDIDYNEDSDNNSSNNDSDDSNKNNNSISTSPKSNLSNGKITNLPSSSLDSGAAYSAKKRKIQKSKDLADAFDYTIKTIYNDFVDSLAEKISIYRSNLILGNSFGYIPDLSTKYVTPTSEITVNGYEHISDNIIRAQIIYDQKCRLLSKMYSINNSIVHFKSVYAAKELYTRYKSEKIFKNNKSLKDKFVYDTLIATKSMYYDKYCNAVSNIYKYYDSCSELIGECLNIQSQIFVSRNILNK